MVQVSYVTGTVKDIPGMESIRELSSFNRAEMHTQPGSQVKPTVDCFTRPGAVQLVNSDSRRLEDDYKAIRTLECNGLFELI